MSGGFQWGGNGDGPEYGGPIPEDQSERPLSDYQFLIISYHVEDGEMYDGCDTADEAKTITDEMTADPTIANWVLWHQVGRWPKS